jgi:hypothetical protein
MVGSRGGPLPTRGQANLSHSMTQMREESLSIVTERQRHGGDQRHERANLGVVPGSRIRALGR